MRGEGDGSGRRHRAGLDGELEPAVRLLERDYGLSREAAAQIATYLGEEKRSLGIVTTLEPIVLAAARSAIARPLDDLGSAAPMIDWTSMQHETQHTRLFRS